jgi:hypothetical protein
MNCAVPGSLVHRQSEQSDGDESGSDGMKTFAHVSVN